MSWTENKVNKLRELWGKGNTASQIAEIIGGVSRNAVIGKAHRLNLSSKLKARSSINQNKIEVIKKIGYQKGHEFSHKFLKDSEGLICRIVK